MPCIWCIKLSKYCIFCFVAFQKHSTVWYQLLLIWCPFKVYAFKCPNPYSYGTDAVLTHKLWHADTVLPDWQKEDLMQMLPIHRVQTTKLPSTLCSMSHQRMPMERMPILQQRTNQFRRLRRHTFSRSLCLFSWCGHTSLVLQRHC